MEYELIQRHLYMFIAIWIVLTIGLLHFLFYLGKTIYEEWKQK
ncbi:hypothetical protein [Fodinisporobacter ferrooxydans]